MFHGQLQPAPLEVWKRDLLEHRPNGRLLAFREGEVSVAAALLPERLPPQPKRYGLVALVDGTGAVLRTLHGPAGRYRMVTGVRQQGESLCLGSLTERAVGRVRL